MSEPQGQCPYIIQFDGQEPIRAESAQQAVSAVSSTWKLPENRLTGLLERVQDNQRIVCEGLVMMPVRSLL